MASIAGRVEHARNFKGHGDLLPRPARARLGVLRHVGITEPGVRGGGEGGVRQVGWGLGRARAGGDKAKCGRTVAVAAQGGSGGDGGVATTAQA